MSKEKSENWDKVTVRQLFDLIEEEHLACLVLEGEALYKKDFLSKAALRRQGNSYEDLYQEIMKLVDKISLMENKKEAIAS